MIAIIAGPILVMFVVGLVLLIPLAVFLLFAFPIRFISDNAHKPVLMALGVAWLLCLVSIALWGLSHLSPSSGYKSIPGPYAFSCGACDTKLVDAFLTDKSGIENSIWLLNDLIEQAQENPDRPEYTQWIERAHQLKQELDAEYAAFVTKYKSSARFQLTSAGAQEKDRLRREYDIIQKTLENADNRLKPCGFITYKLCSY